MSSLVYRSSREDGREGGEKRESSGYIAERERAQTFVEDGKYNAAVYRYSC